MTNTWLGGAILAIVGAVGVGYVLWYVQAWRWPWRRILPLLPTPALAIASSYGVYAFNLMFVPAWVAFAMAAAYELVYIGFAAMTAISAQTRATARRIATAAASISFLQNLIAGLLHALPELRGVVDALSMPRRAGIWIALAALHAVQVFIAFYSAELTLHKAHEDDDIYSAQRVYPAPEPMVDSAPGTDDTAPEDVNTDAPEVVNSPTPDIKIATPDNIDPRAVTARRMRGQTNPATGRPYTWQEIADHIGVNSRQAAQRLATRGTTHGGAK